MGEAELVSHGLWEWMGVQCHESRRLRATGYDDALTGFDR